MTTKSKKAEGAGVPAGVPAAGLAREVAHVIAALAVARVAVLREREATLAVLLAESTRALAVQAVAGPEDGNEAALSAAVCGAHLVLEGAADIIRRRLVPGAPLDADLVARVETACAEVGREVAMRRKLYPGWVQNGRLSQADSERQIGALEDAAALLRMFSGVAR
jgi:hypothetical protein